MLFSHSVSSASIRRAWGEEGMASMINDLGNRVIQEIAGIARNRAESQPNREVLSFRALAYGARNLLFLTHGRQQIPPLRQAQGRNDKTKTMIAGPRAISRFRCESARLRAIPAIPHPCKVTSA